MKIVFLLLLTSIYVGLGDESNHQYSKGDPVIVWVNKVGPNFNPQETYRYDSLPFCKPAEKIVSIKSDSMGSLFQGNDLRDSGIAVNFQEDRAISSTCTLDLTEDAVNAFSEAIQNRYWYQMYVDELPIWGPVGQVDTDKSSPLICTHTKLAISYNNDRIIHVNLTSDAFKPIQVGAKYPMTFEVVWSPTDKQFEDRFDYYLDVAFFEHQIHWFSIFNSFMMVLFLCGLVALVLMRTLRNDYARYSLDDDGFDLDNIGEESGWKQVHGDVFRAPLRLPWLCAFFGIGHHFFCTFVILCLLSIAGNSYRWRGLLLSNAFITWCLTSFVGGYSSGSYYKLNGGRDWKYVFVLSLCVVPAAVVCVLSFVNFIAISYSASSTPPVSVILTLVAIWAFICAPLMLVGTVLGRNLAKAGNFPCRVSSMRRPIPLMPWYFNETTLALLGGILPFGSILIEMHFILTALWNYKFYYVYGFLLLVFGILTIVTVCVTVVIIYFRLNSEDYRWQWMAFNCGVSTGFYVFLYCCYYFVFKTKMSGFLQDVFYFGYSLLLASGVSFVCGSVALTGGLIFVNRIYKDIKSD
uniref:Transmembrane 9 superfamily member n=1 Tax=Spongospora subterranea TaxID=70186 RepID=A0A0H5R8L6_9EUKA|eukprot:CRZ10468.1 hypothetical protein [Spongospora subterranea]